MTTVIDNIEQTYLRQVQLHWNAYCSRMSLVTVQNRQLSQTELSDITKDLGEWIACFAIYNGIAQTLASIGRGQLLSNLSEIKKSVDSTLHVYATMLSDGIARDGNIAKIVQPGLNDASESIRKLFQVDTPLLTTLQADNERISAAISAFRSGS
jgi:hypothetical protein